MTFDEVLNKSYQDVEYEAINSEYDNYYLAQDVQQYFREVIEKLKVEYAPTVEMTQLQVAQMMSFKAANVGFGTFIYKQGLGEVPAFKDWIQQDREDELMQAWLRPETIKVVDDD